MIESYRKFRRKLWEENPELGYIMYGIDEDGRAVTEIRLPKKKKKRNAATFQNEGEKSEAS